MSNPIFVGWHSLEIFPAPLKEHFRHYVSVPAFWQNWEASRILCVQYPQMCANYLTAFGDNDMWFVYLLLEKAMTKFIIMFSFCFIQAADYAAINLFLPACLQRLAEDGRTRANEEVLVPLLFEMTANILERDILRTINDCALDRLSPSSAFALWGD